MIELDAEARRRLDEYLGRVRTALRGCRSVDPADVERDILDHIESDLAEIPSPVGAASLQPVLDKLGSPGQWVPEEERAWWWRALSHLREGPEDLRLAYLTFALFVLALLAFPAFLVFMLGSFLLARATLAFSAEQGEIRPQRWLIYPPLIVVYPFLGLLALLGPVSWVGSFFDLWVRRGFPFGPFGGLGGWKGFYARRWHVLALPSAPVWFIFLGLLMRRVPGFFAAVFAPFLPRERAKRIGKWLVWIGVILVAVGIIAAAVVLIVAAVTGQLGPRRGLYLQ